MNDYYNGVLSPSYYQEGWLPQTDRASAFVINRIKTLLTSSLTTTQNFVVDFHTVRAHVGGPKMLGCWGPVLLG